MIRIAATLAIASLVAACQHTQQGSIAGGESKVFERPPYAVKGKRPYDQSWIDNQIEGGVAAFGWDRPAPRPASIDTPTAKQVVKKPNKRPGLVKRIKARVWPAKVPSIIPAPVAPERPAPAPPRDPVDELLQPGGN